MLHILASYVHIECVYVKFMGWDLNDDFSNGAIRITAGVIDGQKYYM